MLFNTFEYFSFSAIILVLSVDNVYVHPSKNIDETELTVTVYETTTNKNDKPTTGNNSLTSPAHKNGIEKVCLNCSYSFKNEDYFVVESETLVNNTSIFYEKNKKINTRRFTNNMEEVKEEMMKVRPPTDPLEGDCLQEDRKRLRFAPFGCYSTNWNSWSFDNEFWPFMKEIFNDLRFTFDYVLHDETEMKTQKESKLWYLMYYLRSVVENVKNPAEIVRTVKGENKFYCNSLAVYTLEEEILEVESESTTLGTRVIASLSRIAFKLLKMAKEALKSVIG